MRNASHLPPILSSPSGSLSVRPGAGAGAVTVTPVILVPLCDSPSLPSLSLLLAQGTTPTAVCFQQDLLERAKQTEDEWLPSALAQIRGAVDMRNQVSTTVTAEKDREVPIILAYSANPGISPYTTQSCIAAGASGVIKPPFTGETVRNVKRMVRAARDGRISSVVDLPPPAAAAGQADGVDPLRSPFLSWPSKGGDKGMSASAAAASSTGPGPGTGAGTKVVLPPTALDMGGEHEGEKVLSAAMTDRHRKQLSLSLSRNQDQLNLSTLTPATHDLTVHQNRNILTPLTARPQRTPTSAEMIANPYVATLSRYCPTYTPRRRSVDVGCLSLALNRATRAFESPLPICPPPPPPPASGHGTPMRRNKTIAPGSTGKVSSTQQQQQQQQHTHQGTETHLAELLSEMYCQSSAATEVHMAEYAR